MLVNHFIFLLLISMFDQSKAFFFGKKLAFEQLPIKNTFENNIDKEGYEPVLTCIDPTNKAKIHLIGVSHGSPASADLVAKTMTQVNPDAVVLELCSDRFLSISLDAQIPPSNNRTMLREYNRKRSELQSKGAISESTNPNDNASSIKFVKRLQATLKFALKQNGPIGFAFVIMGLIVGSVQRFSRTSKTGDEFVTAMRLATNTRTPIFLGDAPQNATISSISKVASSSTFDPSLLLKSAKALLFSAFGLRFSNDLLPQNISRKLDKNVMDSSEFISIPKAYLQNSKMVSSAYPFLILAILPALSSLFSLSSGFTGIEGGSISSIGGSVDAASASTVASILDDTISTTNIINTQTTNIDGISSLLSSIQSFEVPQSWIDLYEEIADVLSLILLVRMGKIIGSDRDEFIAREVQNIAKSFPGKDVVVVIGMLHVNGVARLLLSGEDLKVALVNSYSESDL